MGPAYTTDLQPAGIHVAVLNCSMRLAEPARLSAAATKQVIPIATSLELLAVFEQIAIALEA